MNIEEFRAYCLAKNAVTEGFPFDDTTLVMKVLDKMFALANLDGDLSINLKCIPEKALELREKYTAVLPGYHMNKKHWNTVKIDGSIPDKIIKLWIDDSYNLVVSKMSKKMRESITENYTNKS
jgi:predicted DNA-binding protein (MmcQ/YjbR family)